MSVKIRLLSQQVGNPKSTTSQLKTRDSKDSARVDIARVDIAIALFSKLLHSAIAI
jgi:hypothetical protein